MSKPFKETKVGVFLKEKYPIVIDTVLGVIGTAFPAVSGITTLVSNLVPNMPEKDKAELDALLSDYENGDYQEYLKDVQNARAREVAINESANSSWLSKNMLPIIAICTVIFAVTIFTLVLTRQLAATDNLTFLVVGYISGLATTVYNYLFGSSKSSSAKDDTIKKMMQ